MTAPVAPAVDAAAGAQLSQAGLAAVVAATVPGLMDHVRVHDLAATQRDLTVLLTNLAHRYGLASAALAVQQYLAARRTAGLGRITIRPAAPAPLEQVATAVRWATQGLYGPEPNLPVFQTKLTGVAEKLVLDTGRRTIVDTVHSDRQARGWARIPEANPCSFCALLATRGAVYKANTVGFRSHDHCRCHAEPIFGRYEPSERVQAWRDIYASIPHGKPAQVRAAFRNAYEASGT